MKIHCDKHGDVEFVGTPDFEGDGRPVTAYCPKCKEDADQVGIKIKRIDKLLPLPAYQTSGSVAFDIYSRVDASVHKDQILLIPTNLIIQVPKGCMLMIALRSSTPRKYNLTMPHGVGIIDQDFCGDEDEIMIQVMGTQYDVLLPTFIPRGERIAQGIFIPVFKQPMNLWSLWHEVDNMNAQSRGGFGSTDERK